MGEEGKEQNEKKKKRWKKMMGVAMAMEVAQQENAAACSLLRPNRPKSVNLGWPAQKQQQQQQLSWPDLIFPCKKST